MNRAGRVAAAAALAAAAIVVVGRTERTHERRGMLDGIDRVRAAIGPSLSVPGPVNWVHDVGETCLLYASGGRSYALELCFDARGRAVEAIDRRGVTTKVYTVASEPGYARLRIDPALVPRLLSVAQRAARAP